MTVTDPDILAWRGLADRFRPKPRRWATPGALACDMDASTVQTRLLDLVDAELVTVADSAAGKAMIFTPPQEGKSSRVALWFPLWLLQHDPRLNVVIVSYDAELAVRWGRDIRRLVQDHPELGVMLRPDSKAAGRWHTAQGGSVYCTGFKGGFTGRPADVLIVDDPVKDRKAAESRAERGALWDWWENVAKVRARRVVLVMTRWHTDDLAGRLLLREREEWRVLSVPAVAGTPVRVPVRGGWRVEWRSTGRPDPLGRTPGQELPSVHGPLARPAGYFLRLFERLSGYVWRALFQQDPTAAQGTLFLRDRWQYWTWDTWPHRINLGGSVRDLRDCWRYVTADLAATTRTSGDFTVAAAWALTMDRLLICLGVVRDRVADTGHWALIRPLAVEWRAPDVGVESSMMGTTLVRQAVRGGLQPFDLHADADKLTRAIPYAHMVAERQVWLPDGADWCEEWVGEHADFPAGAHDDQVDVGAYAARVAHGWNPAQSPAGTGRVVPDPGEAAITAALGNGHHGRDPLDMI